MIPSRGRPSRKSARFAGGAHGRAGNPTGHASVARPGADGLLGPSLLALAIVVATVLGSACTADDPVRRDEPDAGVVEGPLSPPELDGFPARTPLEAVTVRGTTDATRVFSRGNHGTMFTAVLPGGSFCQDLAIEHVEDNRIEIFAVGGDGSVSAPATIDVAYDPAAPEPASGNCDGDGGGGCAADETCGGADDETDEDCNGWSGECDLACSGCEDDIYEPNDVAVNVPTLEPGTYPMSLCPCRDDWFAFHVGAGDRIEASIAFTDAAIDIDMKLFPVNPDGSSTGTYVDSSTGTTDTEMIDYVSAAGGTYYLRIFPFSTTDKPSGTYSLTISD